MTIEELRALIATPMKNEAVKTGLPVLLLLRTEDKRYNQSEMEKRLCVG